MKEIREQEVKDSMEAIFPRFIMANLLEIEKMKAGFKIPMMKKLIAAGELEAVKIGAKLHITRVELIRYLVSNRVGA